MLSRLFFILMVLVPVAGEALTILEPLGSIELFINPKDLEPSIRGDRYSVSLPPQVMGLNVQVGMRFLEHFTFDGGLNTLFAVGASNKWGTEWDPYPINTAYWFRTEIQFDFLSIGYKHQSTHNLYVHGKNFYDIPETSFDKIYLKLEYNL